MVNHALYAGLQDVGATPFTSDPFHKQILDLKIKRAGSIPETRQILEDRAVQQQVKQNLVALSALSDPGVGLPTLSPKLPLEEVLKYRAKHDEGLREARNYLVLLARRIREAAWTQDFDDELDHDIIPTLIKKLAECKKARDSWLNSTRVKIVLDALNLTVGAAAIIVPLVLSPTSLLPVGAVLGLISTAVIPGSELAFDWKQGKKDAAGNGLHYLLKI
jgi:hypothetical protein